MRNFVINLDRSPERMSHMADLLSGMQIPFERFPAFDGKSYGGKFPYYERVGRPMIAGEFGTMQSHLSLWRKLANSNEDYFVVFEDDILISAYLPELLRLLESNTQIFEKFDIVRFEAMQKKVIVDQRVTYDIGQTKFYRLVAPNFGLAGYALSKRIAERLVKIYEEAPMFSDHIFLRENMKKYAVRVGQAHPALVVQDNCAHQFGCSSLVMPQTFQRMEKGHAKAKYKAERTMSWRLRKNIKNEMEKIIARFSFLFCVSKFFYLKQISSKLFRMT